MLRGISSIIAGLLSTYLNGQEWGVGTDLGPESPGIIVTRQKTSEIHRLKTSLKPDQAMHLQLDWLRTHHLTQFSDSVHVYAGVGWIGKSSKIVNNIVEESHYIHFPLGSGYELSQIETLVWGETNLIIGRLPATSVEVAFSLGVTFTL